MRTTSPRRPLWRRPLACAMSAVLVLGLASASRADDSGPSVAPPDRAGPADSAWLVADHLRSAYGVSEAEAWRRVEMQRRLPKLAEDLERRLPGSYAGVWLDQENGGLLNVATTDPAAASAALAGIPDRAHLRIVPAKRSLRALQASATRIQHSSPGTRVGVDVVRNRVKVEVPAGRPVAGAAAEGAAITQAPLTEAKAGYRSEVYKADECNPLACNPPMRGGLRLDIRRTDSGAWAGCTNGFNVKDSRGWVYTLTAGHCLLGSHHSATGEVTFHNGLPVGHETDQAVTYETSGLDFAILPYYGPPNETNWYGYWMLGRQEQNTVAVYRPGLSSTPHYACADGTNDRPGYQCHHSRSVISGIANYGALVGTIVCSSGTASGRTSNTVGGASMVGTDMLPNWKPRTSCGRVRGISTYEVDADICTAPGDSGGPLWDPVTGRGIGIVRHGPPAQSQLGACAAPGNTLYSRLDWIFAVASVQYENRHGVNLTYSLITSTSG